VTRNAGTGIPQTINILFGFSDNCYFSASIAEFLLKNEQLTMKATETTPKNKLFLRPSDVMSRYKLSRSTLYRAINEGTIPRPTKLTTRFTGWPIQIIEASLGETIKPAKERIDLKNLVNPLITLHSLALTKILATSSIPDLSIEDLNRAEELINIISPLLDLSEKPETRLPKQLAGMMEEVQNRRKVIDSMGAAQ